MRRESILTCVVAIPLALWAQNSSPAPAQTAPEAYSKTASATKQIKAPFGDFVVWFDPAKWQVGKTSETGEVEFEKTDGEGYAKIISEKVSIPTDTLAKVALINAKHADPEAKIVAQEKRTVNGREVLMMQMDVTASGVPFRFYGYYYGGTSGTIQLVTFTTQTVFAKNVPDFTNFLDGLMISDQPAPASASAAPEGPTVLPLNDGKASIQYDTQKWRPEADEDVTRKRFAMRRGDGYAIVISERIGIDLDALPNVALKNAQSVDPNAHIVSKEKRTVNGVDVWFVKLEATASGVPFTYYDYLYAGKAGTIQLITFTGQNLISEYEADFLEFLNSFRVAAQ